VGQRNDRRAVVDGERRLGPGLEDGRIAEALRLRECGARIDDGDVIPHARREVGKDLADVRRAGEDEPYGRHQDEHESFSVGQRDDPTFAG